MDAILKYPPDVEPDRFQPRPVTLDGAIVQLQPLNSTHVDELRLLIKDETIFDLLFDGPTYFEWGLPALIHELVKRGKEGTDLPFAVIDRKSKLTVGFTRYLHINKHNKSLEIATCYATDFHGTGVNTEAKYLLLRHAFEALNYVRVQFRIDKRNKHSIDATKRIGAKFEGTIKKDCILADGTERTSLQFRICNDEWDSKVKSHILKLLDKHSSDDPEIATRIAHLQKYQAEVLTRGQGALTRVNKKVADAIARKLRPVKKTKRRS